MSKKIVFIGDSWPDYPEILGTGGGLCDHLESQIGQKIINAAHHGDGSEVTLSLSKRHEIEALLPGTDILCVSMGGDDIAGDQCCLWFNDNNGDKANAINFARFNSAVELIVACYEDLVEMRDDLAPNCLIVTHAYDFPPAEVMGRGVCLLGPWLQPSLRECGWNDTSDQAGIVRAMLTIYGDKIRSLPIRNRIHIESQGICEPDDWQNELHLEHSGWTKQAAAWAAEIKPHLAGPGNLPE